MKRKILNAILALLGAVVLLLGGLIVFLTVTEYKPAPVETASHIVLSNTAPEADETLTLCSWNIGYAGLGKDSDFFMDGGTMVNPPSKDAVRANMEGIRSFIANTEADVWLFQEVDINSARTDGMNQFQLLDHSVNGSSAFAYNYKCPFVPIPFPPLGRVESGLATMTDLLVRGESERVSLPCPFSWPVRTANIKRCLLVTRLNVENSEKQVVLVNLHLEAYESGEGRIAQTKQLLELMQSEYDKGNYVIAGGDFNQSFPDSLEVYPVADPEKWTPGILEEDSLNEGWQFAYDNTAPTCRLLDAPYSGENQLYVIDGFILSPNVRLDKVQTVSLDFEHSDHNPVLLDVTLLP